MGGGRLVFQGQPPRSQICLPHSGLGARFMRLIIRSSCPLGPLLLKGSQCSLWSHPGPSALWGGEQLRVHGCYSWVLFTSVIREWGGLWFRVLLETGQDQFELVLQVHRFHRCTIPCGNRFAKGGLQLWQ